MEKEYPKPLLLHLAEDHGYDPEWVSEQTIVDLLKLHKWEMDTIPNPHKKGDK